MMDEEQDNGVPESYEQGGVTRISGLEQESSKKGRWRSGGGKAAGGHTHHPTELRTHELPHRVSRHMLQRAHCA